MLQGVVERRNTQPILAHVLIEPGDGGIALAATDMEVGLRCQLAAHHEEEGTITVNARKLYEIAREVTADELTLPLQPREGWVEVVAGRSRFKVVKLSAQGFPELPLGPGAVAAPRSGSPRERSAR